MHGMTMSPQIVVMTTEIESLRRKVYDSEEVARYYNRMAEDYRQKFLALERDFNYLKHTHTMDMENKQQEFERTAQ